MSASIARPKLEGNIAVGEDRRIGFAEFGDPRGKAMFWLHGTPGARRQIPTEARVFAERENIRLIGIDRPGIGSSTPHRYGRILDFTDDIKVIADTLGVDTMAVVGLSGGGAYTLACAAAMPDRVLVCGVLGGVVPATGPDAIGGGLMALGSRVAPLLEMAGPQVSGVTTALLWFARPVASAAIGLFAAVSPAADRDLLNRPEFKAMFLDDVLNGSRKQAAAPFADMVLFARDWGFRLADVTVPVHWWHGDHDHIIPFTHGEQMVARLPNARLYRLPGESHLGALGRGEEILRTMLAVWDEVS